MRCFGTGAHHDHHPLGLGITDRERIHLETVDLPPYEKPTS